MLASSAYRKKEALALILRCRPRRGSSCNTPACTSRSICCCVLPRPVPAKRRSSWSVKTRSGWSSVAPSTRCTLGVNKKSEALTVIPVLWLNIPIIGIKNKIHKSWLTILFLWIG
jgi:hypothetical protein